MIYHSPSLLQTHNYRPAFIEMYHNRRAKSVEGDILLFDYRVDVADITATVKHMSRNCKAVCQFAMLVHFAHMLESRGISFYT